MKTHRKKILHLTTHVGGGVGTVLLNYLKKISGDSRYVHSLQILGYADDRAKQYQKDLGFLMKEGMARHRKALLGEIAEADIILIHWWNHPLMTDFLVREALPPARVIIWCHIAGMVPPNNLTRKILAYPDRFIFTTPLTYKAPDVKALSRSQKKKLGYIWSTGGLKHLQSLRVREEKIFNIGYLGSVDYAKMHPLFVQMSSQVHIPQAHFTIIGGPNHIQIKEELNRCGQSERFTFTGVLMGEEKWKHFTRFQVFGYPLAPYHYGTCDQSLQEAMALGSVPVVLANPMELSMVKHNVTGLVARNEKGYHQAILRLFKNPTLRRKLSRAARAYALREFSIEKVVRDWDALFRELLREEKTSSRTWDCDSPHHKLSSARVFIESLGKHGRPFKMFMDAKKPLARKRAERAIVKLASLPQWQSETKSTVHNFNHFLPGDKYLAKWSKLMRHAQRQAKKS